MTEIVLKINDELGELKEEHINDIEPDIREYINHVEGFKSAITESEKLKQKFINLEYEENEITTWIEVNIKINRELKTISYSTYAYAKSQHSQDYSYVVNNSAHSIALTSNGYSKSRNIIGQKIINQIFEIKKKIADEQQLKEETAVKIYENIIRETIIIEFARVTTKNPENFVDDFEKLMEKYAVSPDAYYFKFKGE